MLIQAVDIWHFKEDTGCAAPTFREFPESVQVNIGLVLQTDHFSFLSDPSVYVHVDQNTINANK
jgi:hypothetical protein